LNIVVPFQDWWFYLFFNVNFLFKITYPKHQKLKEITCLSLAKFWELKTIV
jgi:hypothetical protein